MAGTSVQLACGVLLAPALMVMPAIGQGVPCGPVTITQNETTVVNDGMVRCITGTAFARAYDIAAEQPSLAGKPVVLTCVEFAIVEHVSTEPFEINLNVWLDPTGGEPDVASRVLLQTVPVMVGYPIALPAWFNVSLLDQFGCGTVIPADSQIIVEIEDFDTGIGLRLGRNGGDDPDNIPAGEHESRSTYMYTPTCAWGGETSDDYIPLGDILVGSYASHHLVQVLHLQELTDCNGNGVFDSCETTASFHDGSGQLGPIGLGAPVSHTVVDPPAAIDDVTLSFRAVADLSSTTKALEVLLNGEPIGEIFETSGTLCPATPDADEITLSAAMFNDLVTSGGGNLAIDIRTFDGVFGQACGGTSWVSVDLDYVYELDVDTNGNGVLDECDLARGDNNLDGVVDIMDLLNLLAAWGPCPAPCPEDTNADALVDITDLLSLLAGWG